MSQTSLKARLLAAVVHHLETEIETLEASARAARDEATSDEAKPENKYDTRALEASYLAGAQSERLAELQRALAMVKATTPRPFGPDDPIGPTALIEVDQSGHVARYFMLAQGAGIPLTADGRAYTTITAHSPLGKALLGKRSGDSITLRVAGTEKEYEILAIA